MSRISTRWFLGMAVGGAIALGANSALAQITPDRTLPNNSSVTVNGSTFNITGGTQAGRNLFHSFQQFSVPTGGTASFMNGADIQNIISRVTGGSVSNIDGLIKANGTANLFLINPSGIIFGPNASLNVGGSFVGTTANAIQFGDRGFFSATNPEAPSPLLTINPSALLFNQIATAPIQNNSSLSVLDGKSLLLVGGNINMDGGQLNANGGRVELSGLAAPGTVGIEVNGNNLSLGFPDSSTRADISLTNGAYAAVEAAGGGSIAVNARNLEVSGGSELSTGIGQGLGNAEAKAGNITLNATGHIKIDGSFIVNYVRPQATGNAGDINITTGTLSLTNGAGLYAITYGRGDAGSVNINARDTVTFDGGASDGYISGAFSYVNSGGVGKSGNLNITTGTLSLTNGAGLYANTLGLGNAGSINILAGDNISLDGTTLDGTRSVVSSTVGATSAPVIRITLNEQNRPVVTVEPRQQTVFPNARGNSGNINITTESLSVTNGAQLTTNTFGQGNAGSINVNTFNAKFSGTDTKGSSSGAFSTVQKEASGNSGVININTADKLTVDNGAQLVASTFGNGNAGDIRIVGKEVLFNGVSGNTPSGTFSAVASGGVGEGGNVNVTTDSLISVTNGAQLSAAVETGASGNGGNLTIATKRLNILNGAEGTVSNLGSGNAGNLEVRADFINLNNQGKVIAESATGNGGNINLSAPDLVLLNNNSLISAISNGSGNAGNIAINSGFLIGLEKSNIIANAANSGFNLILNAQGFLFSPGSEIIVNGEKITDRLPRFLLTVAEPPVVRLANAPDLIKTSCAAFDTGGSSFTVTGRGGLPPSPDEPLTNDVIWTDARIPATTQQSSNKPPIKPHSKPKAEPIVIAPATGWVFNGLGEVTLISSAPNTSGLRTTPSTCPGR